jgi:hypothetical protein
MQKRRPLFALFLLLAAGSAAAADWSPGSAFVAAGTSSPGGTSSFTAGVTWPWGWRHASGAGEWTAATELMLNHWNAREPGGGHASFNQLALVPVVRFRFAGGTSPWFAEAGIGVSYTDRLYVTERKRFSTRFNFHDNVGFGRSFGERREHELSLRLSHVSNAGIRHPNPGENFVQLRYGHTF